MQTDEPVRDGCGTLLAEVVSGVAQMAAPPLERPQATQGALETTAGTVEVEPPVAFDTGLNASTCEALIASAQLKDRHKPSAGPRKLTEHPPLLLRVWNWRHKLCQFVVVTSCKQVHFGDE